MINNRSRILPFIAVSWLFLGSNASALCQQEAAQLSVDSSAAKSTRRVILVVGAGGQPEFASQFSEWADQWKSIIAEFQSENGSSGVEIDFVTIGIESNEKSDLQLLEEAVVAEPSEALDAIWIVLVGHGTFDNKSAKFNLRGRDVSAKQMKGWLAPLKCPIVVVNCASASGPFLNQLAGPNRIVVTATKSGFQYNFSRFGKHFVDAIGDPAIDLDKDQQTSLLEAFLAASAKTQEFYQQENRLATELALIDDNGDGQGTPANWFQGTRVVEKPKKGKADGLKANQVFLFPRGNEARLSRQQIERRNELERELELFREKKKLLGVDAYYDGLEAILIQLSKIYEEDSAGDKIGNDS